jgi:hypothetical protein
MFSQVCVWGGGDCVGTGLACGLRCVVILGGMSFGLHTSKVRAEDRGHTYSLHRTHMGCLMWTVRAHMLSGRSVAALSHCDIQAVLYTESVCVYTCGGFCGCVHSTDTHCTDTVPCVWCCHCCWCAVQCLATRV